MTVVDQPAAPADVTAGPDADRVFTAWVAAFGAALEAGDADGAAQCIDEDGWWRDILAFTWGRRTFHRPQRIAAGLAATLPSAAPREFAHAAGRSAPRAVKRSGRRVVEGFFQFRTAVGLGHGFARIPADDDGRPRAALVLTTLHELAGAEEAIGARRPSGVEWSQNFTGDNWADTRRAEQSYTDHDPQVLVVGGGQSGLMLGARLRQFGVDALIIEKNDRIGDNWRHRYHSLTLHNEVWANHLPYVPFPPTWPTFVPKDKLAGFLEAYAEFLELNVWTGTTFGGATWDQTTRIWTARVTGPDGTERVLRVPHLVLASGSVSGAPRIPKLPGLDDFAGEVIHSSRFTSGLDHRGKHAIVVGTGNSGHDVAQELHGNGASSVTVVQRGATAVVSLVPSGTLVYSLYSEGPPVEDIDLITASIPYDVLRDTYQWITRRTCQLDRDLLDRLRTAGFEIDFEPDHTGFHMRYLRTGGGYYINVGCSDLIADGEVGLVQARDTEHFTPDGLLMADGRTIPADLVVLATGYENQQETLRHQFGTEVAEKVGPVWGFDDHGFMRAMWTKLDQNGLWLMGGALNEGRLHSRYLALEIRAALDGLLPDRPLV